jgi:copper chaperone CopZ
MKRIRLTISGMSCGHCVGRVKKTLTGLPGVEVRAVEIGRADIDVDPTLQSLAAVTTALGAAGYPAEVREEA